MTAETELADFIRTSFRSVWTLELLLQLKRSGRPMSQAELVEALRASDAVVANGTETLFAAGLVVIGGDDMVAYRPSSDRLDAQAAAAEKLYSQRPDAVRRLIVNAMAEGAAAFSDAFRFRRD